MIFNGRFFHRKSAKEVRYTKKLDKVDLFSIYVLMSFVCRVKTWRISILLAVSIVYFTPHRNEFSGSVYIWLFAYSVSIFNVQQTRY